MKQIIKKMIFIILGIIASLCLFALIINLIVILKTKDKIYNTDELSSISEEYDCILVLGAGIKANGDPTNMLYDRLKASSIAYLNISVKNVLVSGDSEDEYHDETGTMKRVLTEEFSIDESKIILDGYGLSTYESILRAKEVYGYNKIVIVTQKYHLYRSIYIAEKLGIEAIGVSANLRSYKKQIIYSSREFLARVKDFFYVKTKPSPKYEDVFLPL